MRLRPTEESLDFVRRSGGNRSAHSGDCGNSCVLEIPGDPVQVFGIDVNGEPHRAHELATQRSDLSSLGFDRLGSELLRLSRLRRRHELVPDSWYRQEELGNLCIRLDLAPHSRDKHIHAAIEGIRATTRNGEAATCHAIQLGQHCVPVLSASLSPRG